MPTFLGFRGHFRAAIPQPTPMVGRVGVVGEGGPETMNSIKAISVSIALILIIVNTALAAPSTRSFRTSARIVGIEGLDEGKTDDATVGSAMFDVIQGVCNAGSSDATAEPFYDSLLRIKVRNDTRFLVTFTRFKYQVRNVDGHGKALTSRSLALSSSGEIAPGKTGSLIALFLDASAGRKYFSKQTTPIPLDFGFRNVKVILSGRDGMGRAITLTARTAVSLDDFDRCSN